jgi:hypothetical protein
MILFLPLHDSHTDLATHCHHPVAVERKEVEPLAQADEEDPLLVGIGLPLPEDRTAEVSQP